MRYKSPKNHIFSAVASLPLNKQLGCVLGINEDEVWEKRKQYDIIAHVHAIVVFDLIFFVNFTKMALAIFRIHKEITGKDGQ